MKEVKDLGAIQTNRFSGASANNKELYIVVIEDPTVKVKSRLYLAPRADEGTSTLHLYGYEITNNSKINAQLKDEKYKDALEMAKENVTYESIRVPWQRIVRINAFTYNVK